jgi:hypothetical protein
MIRAFARLSSVLVVGLGVAAALVATTRGQDAEPPSKSRAVADWSLIAQNAIVAVGKKFPGEAAVYMGIVHATIYDAVVAIEGGYRPFAITATAPPNTSVDAAVSTAAYRVLTGRFPDQQASLSDVYFRYLDEIPDGEAKTNGILIGEEIAVGMLVLRANDGLESIVPYVQRPPAPGVYEPTAPATPLGTRMPSVLTLALEKASQFRPDGPPALRSLEYALDFNEVKSLGRFDSSVRSAEQTAVARFWTDHDLPQWNRSLLRLADTGGLTAIETARMLAMAHVAGGDAMIGCFDAKYHYLSWRPIHAIHRADTDGNSHTLPDPTWQPLLPTPNHPEYPSAHACHTTAIAEALESFFGPGRVHFSVDSLVTGDTRHYERFKEVVTEVNNARVWAGFHFRYAQEDGSRIGRKVARFVARNFFQPLEKNVNRSRERVARSLFQAGNLDAAEGLRPILHTMWQHSRTFRAQCARIERAPSLRVVLTRERGTQPSSARTEFTRSNHRLHAAVIVSLDVNSNSLIELIAHELEHVVEQLDGVRLTGRAEKGISRNARDTFETARASHVGQQVASEVRRARNSVLSVNQQ